MTRTRQRVDRPAAIRRAFRDLVAARGFHGASMSAVAVAAGVATGTAYVHYESKEDLVYATYLEIKGELGAHVMDRIDVDAPPKVRFEQILRAAYEHLLEEPSRARFLTQLEESPYHARAHELLGEVGDPLLEQATRSDLMELLVPLPIEVLYALSIGLAVRLAASGQELDHDAVDTLVESCWRAITR